jgi:hypothetical protein
MIVGLPLLINQMAKLSERFAHERTGRTDEVSNASAEMPVAFKGGRRGET